MTEQDESLVLYLNDAIATTRNKETLFRLVTAKLRLVFSFDAMAIITLDAEYRHRRVFLRDYLGEVLPGDMEGLMQQTSGRLPIHGTPLEQLLEPLVQQPHVQQHKLRELVKNYVGLEPFHTIYNIGMRYATIVPLRTGGQLIGLMSLVTRDQMALPPEESTLLEKIGNVVAVAVTNTLAFEDLARREQEKVMQLALTNALLRIQERDALFRTITTEINRVVPCDYFGIRLPQPNSQLRALVEYAKGPDGSFQALDERRWENMPDFATDLAAVADLFARPGVYVGLKFAALVDAHPLNRYIQEQLGTQSLLCVPLELGSGAALILASRLPRAFNDESLDLLQSLASQIQLAVQNVFAFEHMAELQAQLERERTYLIDELNTAATASFDGFVGGSPVMQQVFRQVEQVAATDSTVLVTGETGTGKELVARALHNRSPRQKRPLIKLNCAALPAQLIESELFGHEKGAFTGAIERRIGKFELADGGTIFLDEIGELPLDLQAKLLRVLQEKEFERLGGRQVLETNVRVIAATNRVLEKEVAAGRFRADLYYRLNVFPIHLPALRERPEDVEPLVRHFLEHFTKKLGKPVRRLRPQDLKALQRYSWPGNIRELEHVVERAVIASSGSTLEFAGVATPPLNPLPTTAVPTKGPWKTMQELERDYILAALECTGSRISGPHGAAVLLDINAKTLETRMKKLGIRRTYRAE